MKKQIFIGLSLFVFGFVQAQKTENYIHFHLGGGSQSFNYNFLNGTTKAENGYALDAGYTHFFSSNWGLSLGLGAQRFGTKSTLTYQSVAPNQTDVVGDSYEFRADYKNWQEKQQGVFFDIPLAVEYRHFLSDKFGLKASAGAKISIPVQANYKTEGGEIVTTGYYSKWKALLHDLPKYGFSTYSGPYTGDISLNIAYAGIADFGVLYKVSPKIDVYLGGYINYGLNNVISQGSKPIYDADGTYNGFFVSDQVNKVNPIAFGAKAGIYWKVNALKRKIILDIVPTAPVTVAEKLPSGETNPATGSTHTLLGDSIALAQAKISQKPDVNPTDVKQPDQTKGLILDEINRIAKSLNLKFAFNGSKLDFGSELQKITILADNLKLNPDLYIHIIGHTCNLGTRAANMRIGLKRALMVKQKFIELGVPELQLKALSKGYDEPLVPNTSEANRAINRRVEIKVFEKEK